MVQPHPIATRTRAQGAKSRERILNAAERLMSERGYAATGIASIRKESGLPASSIYWHFGSKEGLLAAVMERSAMRWLSDLEEAEILEGDPEERLRRLLVLGFASLGERPPEFLRLSIHLSLERGDHPATIETIRRVRERSSQILVTALASVFAKSGQEAANRAARECATFAVAFCEGCFIGQQIEPERFDTERLAEQLHLALMALGERIATRTGKESR